MSAAYWALRAKYPTDADLAKHLFEVAERQREEIEQLENQVELQRRLRRVARVEDQRRRHA